jgi:hypothetical protein
MADISLRQILKDLRVDLPPGFDASRGIRSLWPAGRDVSVRSLGLYRFVREHSVSGADAEARVSFVAYGSGQWSLTGIITSSSPDPVKYAVAVTFRYSDSRSGHGVTADGTVFPGPFGGNTVPIRNNGNDPWLRDHWPEAFAAGVSVNLGTSESVGPFLRALLPTLGFEVLVALA